MIRILIMAGGTGGHLMPALAVAERLRARGAEVCWIGTADSLEAKLVPRAGFQLHTIRIKGLRQSGAARVAVMPFMLLWAMAQALAVMARRKPHAVLGMGGFVSGPGGLIACLLRRPLVVHEQNTVAGLTNRHLARFARRALSGFPAVKGMAGATWVGNPVRREIAELPAPKSRLAGRRGPMRVLVVGGSRGAEVFNQRLPGLLARAPQPAPEVWHQCGPHDPDTIGKRYLEAGIRSRVSGFIDDMAGAYAWCDLVICRAGAMTVSEVCAAGVAALLVPYPFAVSDHQTGNAAWLQSRSAARLVAQDDFVRGAWLEHLGEWQRDRRLLVEMAQAARHLARPHAAAEVARVCLEVADG